MILGRAAIRLPISSSCQGGGLYDIRIVPFIDNPACAWLSGEHVYAIQLEFTRAIGGETVVLHGGTLGKLAIP